MNLIFAALQDGPRLPVVSGRCAPHLHDCKPFDGLENAALRTRKVPADEAGQPPGVAGEFHHQSPISPFAEGFGISGTGVIDFVEEGIVTLDLRPGSIDRWRPRRLF
ncbi:MAG TPA: hypothetical protein VGS13_15460 [Stellaceae bacterium]|nr:hypothetical protein [Stellaceae bacterium]